MNTKIKDISNQKYGKLIPLKLADPPSKNGNAIWICQCECGETREVFARSLKRGETYACAICTKRIVSKKLTSLDTFGRKEAKAKGQLFYEGSPCKKGHGSKRRVSNGSCVICESEKQKIYKANKTCIFCGKIFQGRPTLKTCSKECQINTRRKTKRDSIKKFRETQEGYIESTLRARINSALRSRGDNKKGSTFQLTGKTSKELLDYFEENFNNLLNWDERGSWHVDHIRPCSSFNLNSKSQQKVCFNWRNLQILSANKNLVKSSQYKREDEIIWTKKMRDLGYKGELFLKYN